jgi:8-oxo-dGTP diphosphatase
MPSRAARNAARLAQAPEEEEYPSAYLAADVIVMREDDVLLIRRRDEPFQGFWALPGGFLDAHNDDRGETPLQGAVREAREEIGLNLDGKLMFLGVYADPGRDPRGRVVDFVYLTRVNEDAEVVAGDDAASAVWCPREDIPWDQLAFDHATILHDAGLLPSGMSGVDTQDPSR